MSNYREYIIKFFFLLSSLFLFSCDKDATRFKIIYSSDEPIGEIAHRIKDILDKGPGMEAELIIGQGSVSNVDSLLKGSADLTIIENNTPVKEGVSSILSFYPQILHILYESDNEITDFKQLVEGRKVFMGVEGSGTYRFAKELFKFFEVDESKVEITDNPFDHEVYCSFGDIIKDDNLVGLESFRLFSFDKVVNFEKGSIAEAICLKYPQFKPFIIPRSTYHQLTPDPVITLAVNAILVIRADIPEEDVYLLTKTLFENHQRFNSISPLIYLDLLEHDGRDMLNFPLHSGTKMYLDRDEPKFFERYAELIGVIFSVLIALVSGLISFSKWRSQIKKDRIDVFYKKVMEIKNGTAKLRSSRDVKLKILQLQKEQDKAFKLLINEKLMANESFRIYMELNKETIQTLFLRLRAFKKVERDSGRMSIIKS